MHEWMSEIWMLFTWPHGLEWQGMGEGSLMARQLAYDGVKII